MLDAGLCTLDYLKSRLLPEAARIDTEYDAALSKLGLAIAGRMEGHCARKFDRQTAAVDEFNARTTSVCLRRLPVESITSIEIRDFTGTLDAFPGYYQLDPSAGILDFDGFPGSMSERIVITYAGGYFLDDGTTMPTGATALPDDLLELFIAEVQLHAQTRNIFSAVGLSTASDKDKARVMNGLSEDAIDGLRPYRRFAGE